MIFDDYLGEQLKIEGMEIAADNRQQLLELARNIAKTIAISNPSRTCTADKVGRILKEQYGIDTLGPAAGSLFKTSDWEFTGQFIKSKRITNHARLLRVWKYTGRG